MGDHSVNYSLWIFLLAVIEVTTSVEVHFENKDGGFFLKHTPKQHFQPIPDLSSVLPSSSTPSSVLSVDRFTVFQSSQPISVRATYGPFSTKQTVPARYIVPDPLDSLPPLPPPIQSAAEHGSNASAASAAAAAAAAAAAGVELQELVTHHLDMSAHIVRSEIPRDSPVLRVLFHTGADPGGRRQLLLARHQRVCIVLHASIAEQTPLSAACSPDGEDGVCLAQVTIPSGWWPPLPPPDKHGRPGKPVKTPPRLVQVAYSVLEPRPADGEGCLPRIQIQPVTVLGCVPLVPAKAAYKELRVAEIVTMLVPHPPLFPLSRFHIPVFMERERAKELTAVVIRARVKSGLRILSATPSTDQWNITVEINPKHTGASLTALRREPQEPDQRPPPSAGEVSELFSWLVEVTEGAEELYEGAKMVWSTRFEPHAPESHRGSGGSGPGGSTENRKPTTKLEVQKDDIQAVVPISKNWEVMNTAVLTGRQVSQAMKVFIVSQAGKAADVTLQSSCHSEDESVLKVSSSCSSVYVDGSEARGSVNGSVLVKYATYTGLARFTVWMPEFPLDLAVPDVRLSQIKSWKVPDYHANIGKVKRKKRSFGGWGPSMLPEDFNNGVGPDRPPCRLRYQQSPVDVYAHFLANDHDSGRVTYFVNRRTWLRVTDLVLPLLRVSDPRIASLHGRILQGRSMGRTEVQVLSPITGRVIGAKEVRVGNDKVGISKLSVRVVSGLQLNISPDSSIENGYIAETSVTRRLTAQYQEGLLDIELEFSDGSKTPLRDIADADYHLVVKSLDTEVVAFAPMVASHHPRVIAVGEGNGDLLQVSLLLNEDCRIPTRPKLSGKSPGPLATAAAEVEVDFSVSEIPHRPDFVQNDGGMLGGPRDRKAGRDVTDLHDILIGMPLKDENNHEPAVQARQHHSVQNGVLDNHGHGPTRYQQQANMTPLEIGMYVLLTAFCFAIVVFVVSCVVYASKFKPQGMDAQLGSGNGTAAVPSLGRSTLGMGTGLGIIREPRKPRESTTNAHDWVWLGRATLERSSGQMMQTSGRSSTINNNNSATEMRITTNPMSLNYSEPDDCIIQATSFDNPHHIELPSRHIDSATYCKKDRTNNNGQTHLANININNNNNNNDQTHVLANGNKEAQDWDDSIPPPLPPHAIPLHSDTSAEDYKPPVPPHRNIGVSARISPSNSAPPVVPPPRKHHHHHHHRNSKHQAVVETKKNAFEFDDAEPSSDFDHEIFQLARADKADKINLRHKDKRENEDNVEFVQFPKSADGNCNGIIRGNSPEVKRATIIGNPMFSACVNNSDGAKDDLVPSTGAGATGAVSGAVATKKGVSETDTVTGTTAADLSGLDDLQLDMDYDQIMHYFDNLKESNA